MALFSESQYGKFVSLQNNSGSADAAAPSGGIYLFASGAIGSARLYMQNEGGTVTDLAKSLDIDAFTALGGTGLAQGDNFVFSDGGTEKKVTFSNLEDAIFGNVSGDATIAAGGALTIAAGAVENSMLADDAVGADELAANAVVNASIASNAAIDMDKLDGGSLASSLSDLAQGDLLYAGDVDDSNNIKSITFSNLEDAIFGNVSGDATIAAGGALTIAAQAVENSMLADDAVGADELAANAVVNASVVDGAIKADKLDLDGSTDIGADLVDADLMIVDDGAAGTNRVAALSRIKKYIFSAVSGDAAASDAGALTIAAGAVEHGMLAEDIISGQAALGGATVAQADLLMLDDGPGTVKKVTFSNFEDSIFGNVSGDATIAAGGALTIAAGAVENSMLADDAVGADELAANAVVNASVASNAAIEGTKLNLNVDFGGNIQIGSQSDDVCAFGGPIKVGGNSIVDGGNNGAITFDGSGNTQAAGNLTVGTDGGGKQFTVHGAAANEFMRYVPGDNLLKFQNASSATILTLGGDATSEYAVDVTNGANNSNKIRAAAFVTYSDESLKSDVASMRNTALDTVMSLNGVEFTWKDSGERDFGFIAQDVQNVLPKAVHVAEDGVQGVDYSRLTSVLVEAVKAQQVQIEELKALLKK